MEDKVTEIWKNFDSQLRTLICSKMNNRVECLDVLQDVYIKVINNIDKIGSVENIPSYLNRIASNAVIDHFRKQSNKVVLNDDNFEKLVIADDISNDNSMEQDACMQCIEPGIDTLPPIYKQAFIMSDVEGMPQKEVAEKLGISLSGAKSRVQRAREKLKEEVLKCRDKQL